MRKAWRGLRGRHRRHRDKAVGGLRPDHNPAAHNKIATMVQRVFIKVVGFTDVERHALNSLFRLSEQHDVVYTLWEPGAPQAPSLALIDGQAYEARVVLAAPGGGDLKVIWVGSVAPANAWRVFDRPIPWSEVVHAMDELFHTPVDVDFDFDAGFSETLPPADAPAGGKRALIVSGDRDERLYLRARLSLADFTHADEAESGAQALEFARDNDYAIALIDFALPDMEGWQLARELAQGPRPVPHVIGTKPRATVFEKLRARAQGMQGLFRKPPHPARLHQLLLDAQAAT